MGGIHTVNRNCSISDVWRAFAGLCVSARAFQSPRRTSRRDHRASRCDSSQHRDTRIVRRPSVAAQLYLNCSTVPILGVSSGDHPGRMSYQEGLRVDLLASPPDVDRVGVLVVVPA
eukprot:8316388-Pyramimonas_sp.AAC.1